MVLMMQWGAYDVGNVFQNLESYGFYDYILPFLLIFALVYVILINLPIFKKDNEVQKGPAVIISLAIALLSLRFNILTNFFGEFFPKVGVGVSILLVALILMGTFLKEKNFNYIFMGIGAIIFLWAVFSSTNNFSFYSYGFWNQYGGAIIVLIILIGAIIAIIKGSGK